MNSRLLRVALAAVLAAGAAARAAPPATGAEAEFDRTIAAAKTAMLGDPVRARQLGRQAETFAMTWPASDRRDVAVATAQWIEGEGAYRANDAAAGAPLTRQALAVARRVAPGSKLHGDLLLSEARLQREAGAPQTALVDLQQAYNIFARLRDERSEAKALQSIGSIYLDAQDYARVLYYYRQAAEMSAGDPMLSLSANNNIANAYSHLGRAREAGEASQRSLALANKMQSPLLVARILSNSAELAIDNHDYEGAENAVGAGLRLTTRAAAASWRPILLGTRAKLEMAMGRTAAAQRDIDLAFAGSDSAMTDQSFSTLQLTAYRVYKAVGDDTRALQHLEAYRRTEDEARALAASTNAALMTARFDFVNQNARIATLKTGQLRRDVALTRLRARQSTVIFSSLLALLVTMLFFLFVYLRSVRRSRNEIMAANTQLAQTNVELGDALQAKSQFLATTSHEIRTPLNGILGMTQVMLADHHVGGVLRDRISLVDAAGRAMRTLVDDILDFAKMDSGEVRLDAGPTDLAVLMTDIVSLWRAHAEDKGLDLRLSLTGVDAPLVTDAARLRQVVFNLLSNAIKFTAQGAVTVDVRTEAAASGPVAAIAVADTGIGVPPEAFETIFEPFRQLDTSTTRQFGGTGLGLAISRHLARVLGGDITVAAARGGGSVFTLRLPYLTLAADIAASPATAPAAALLIVSSNPIRRSFLRTALELRVGPAAACEPAAVAATVAAGGVGTILVDLGDDEAALPGTLLADIAGHPPIVLLVPAALAADRAAWIAAGAAQVVVKPLAIDDLAAALLTTARDGAGDAECGVAAGGVSVQSALTQAAAGR